MNANVRHRRDMRLAELRLPPGKQTLRLFEVGRILGVGSRQARRYCDDGKIPTVRTPGGQRVVTRADMERVIRRIAAGEFNRAA